MLRRPVEPALDQRTSPRSDVRLERSEERRRVRKVQCRATTDAHQMHEDQLQQPAAIAALRFARLHIVT